MNIFRKIVGAISSMTQSWWQPPFQSPPEAAWTEDEIQDHLSEGAYYTFGTLLDDLPAYFRSLRRLKKSDLDAYRLYAKIGAQIVSKDKVYIEAGLPAEWRNDPTYERPGFGAVFTGTKDADTKKGMIGVKFLYFSKVARDPAVEKLNIPGDIFAVTTYALDDKFKQSAIFPYHVHVATDGTVRPLKENCVKHVKIKHRDRHGGTSYVTQHSWGYPVMMTGGLIDYKKQGILQEDATLQDFVTCEFARIVSAYMRAGQGFRINVLHEGVMGVFNIHKRRSKVFFKDRDRQVNDQGKTKRIFHFVREHERWIGDNLTLIPEHYRGLRRFNWIGYDVTITVPVVHHPDLREFSLGAGQLIYEDGETYPADTITVEETGERIREVILKP